MSATVYWLPSTDEVKSYTLESATSWSGTFSTVASITGALAGNTAYDSVTARFSYTDPSGSYLTWYRLTMVYPNNGTSAPTDAFQPGGVQRVPLASVADFKTYLNVTNTTDDALISKLLTQASVRFESLCGRRFGVRSYDEFYDGDGTRTLPLRQHPVIGVSSVHLDDDASPIPAATGTTDPGWRLVDDVVIINGVSGPVFPSPFFLDKSTYYFRKGRRNVRVVYSAGYSEIPDDIQAAVIELAALKYKERLRLGLGSESMAGMNATFLPAIVPLSVMSVVEQYRRIPGL